MRKNLSSIEINTTIKRLVIVYNPKVVSNRDTLDFALIIDLLINDVEEYVTLSIHYLAVVAK